MPRMKCIDGKTAANVIILIAANVANLRSTYTICSSVHGFVGDNDGNKQVFSSATELWLTVYEAADTW
jgi:hypothetical protein